MRNTFRIAAGLALVLLLLLPVVRAEFNSVVNSPHNLSASGPGTVRAVSEDRVCIFCHTPHGSRTVAPLWNRRDSAALYTPYDSPTLHAKPGQPTGSSKLCLSCHDGTIALGDLVSESSPIPMSGSSTMPPGGGLIGTDLRDDHPISFSYAEALSRPQGELAAPYSWDPAITLDHLGMMQCTTCHDPHDPQWGNFLVMDNTGASLCRECHRIDGFDDTAHALAGNTWTGSGRDPWPHTDFDTVASNACLNCHANHHAPGKETLLTSDRPEEVCLSCHSGNVADGRVADAFHKPYRHPIFETGSGHRPGEMLDGRADHVTCVDCHSPHKAAASPAEAPFVPGLMEGVSGVTEAGAFVEEAVYEYEVCFKCHAEDSGSGFRSINRQVPSNGVRNQFAAGSVSFHPVVSPGMNSYVPSLISPLNEQSMIYCSDCHGDDTSLPRRQGEPAPVHGSNYQYLLKREYRTGDNIAESPAAYSLCYSCHDRSSILGNESFPQHYRHIVTGQTSCSVCHDAHGVDGARGSSVNNANLINFDISIVEPLPGTGMLEYTDMGAQSGTCSLRCHGNDHDETRY